MSINTASQAQLSGMAMQSKAPSSHPVYGPILQRKCACGTHTIGGSACADCSMQGNTFQRRAARGSGGENMKAAVPEVLHETLRSPGQPLDAGVRSFMEPRFGHDFSGVRVHTDARAAESAQAVNASAYTVGADVVFGEGMYKPGTIEGQELLAHELAHVVQQRGGVTLARRSAMHVGEADSNFEREAESAARAVIDGRLVGNISAGASLIQRAVVAGCQSSKMGVGKIGRVAHDEILRWCNVQRPPCGKLSIPGASSKGTGNYGYADLFFRGSLNSTAEIGEIKPLNTTHVFKSPGTQQLEGYVENYKKQNPGVQVEMMKWDPLPPENGGTPFPDATSKQYLYCSKAEDGHYFYWCQGQKGKEEEPQKVPVPDWKTKLLEELRRRREQAQKEKQKVNEPGKEPAFQPSPQTDWVKVVTFLIIIAIIVALIYAFPAVVGVLLMLAVLILIFLPELLPYIEPVRRELTNPLLMPTRSFTSVGDGEERGGQDAGSAREKVAASAAPESSHAAAALEVASVSPAPVSLTPEQAWQLLGAGAALAAAVQKVEGNDPLTAGAREMASQAAADIESARQESKT